MKHILIASLLVACTTEQQPPAQDPGPVVEQRGGGHQCEPCCTYMYKIRQIINSDFLPGCPYADDQAYAQAAWVVLQEIASELNEDNHGCDIEQLDEICAPPYLCPHALQ